MFLRLDGVESVVGIRGATLLHERQHVDSTLVLDHKAVGCQSRELFKTVLDDDSRGIFQGKIVVRPHAQKTDARMMTQALLLSETAEADNKPELEIFADDVQCGHGATSGALNQDLLFYLKARGIPRKEAEALLIQSFVGEAIEGIEHAGLREVLMEAVATWLKARK
jgi:Fe-S cluster assembly protein SufD